MGSRELEGNHRSILSSLSNRVSSKGDLVARREAMERIEPTQVAKVVLIAATNPTKRMSFVLPNNMLAHRSRRRDFEHVRLEIISTECTVQMLRTVVGNFKLFRNRNLIKLFYYYASLQSTVLSFFLPSHFTSA